MVSLVVELFKSEAWFCVTAFCVKGGYRNLYGDDRECMPSKNGNTHTHVCQFNVLL